MLYTENMPQSQNCMKMQTVKRIKQKQGAKEAMSEQYEVLARIERQYPAMSKNHKKIISAEIMIRRLL